MGDTKPTLDKYTEANACFAGEVKTPFATGETIDSMKKMVAAARPDQVIEVADAWDKIEKKIATGEGSIKADFDKAVEHVLQHWEGESADEFAKKAKKVSKQLTDCATYAQYTSTAMRNAGQKLQEIKPKVEAIEKPSGLASKWDRVADGFTRDDSKWRGEIHGKQGAQQALDKHDDDLSAGKEAQLEMAAHMETLALTYSSQTQTMGSWAKRQPPKDRGGEEYPGEPGGVAPVPVPVTPDGSGPGGAAVPAGRTGASGSVKGGSTTSPVGLGKTGAATKVDGISGGTATGAGRPGPGGSTGGAGAGGPVGGASAGGATGGFAGAPGVAAGFGRGGAGGPGMVGRASANRGIAGGAGGAAGGRGPAGGIGSGAGGKGGSAAAGRGPLARQRGGKLDTPEAGKGAARQGGSGLHSSRGGSEAGQRGRGGTFGQGAAGGANSARRKGNKNDEGQRPDYLVEDEDTWMPERRDVAPPTIG